MRAPCVRQGRLRQCQRSSCQQRTSGAHLRLPRLSVYPGLALEVFDQLLILVAEYPECSGAALGCFFSSYTGCAGSVYAALRSLHNVKTIVRSTRLFQYFVCCPFRALNPACLLQAHQVSVAATTLLMVGDPSTAIKYEEEASFLELEKGFDLVRCRL